MFVVFVLVALLVLGVLVAAHWYLWRRMVRDVSARGTWYRRVGTALIFLLPFTTVVAAVSARSGMPFTVERIFAWPGYLWLAVLLYLLLALLVGEAVRPLLHRLLARRDASGNAPGDVCEEAGDDIGSVARTAPSAQGSPAGAVGTAVAAPAGRTATAVRDGGGD
ncbi:MAG TPA: metallophosphoesterase, partial [Streptomyces sp.]|nr:metallophosphoesterase [Streptomyces sp.]